MGDSTPQPGDYHGPCYADHTCKPGLQCVEDLCLGGGEQRLSDGAVVDGNTGGSSSGSTTSSGSTASSGSSSGASSSGASSSGGTDSGCNSNSVAGGGFHCPAAGDCASGEGCCISSGAGSCSARGPCQSNNVFECDDDQSCAGGVCCVRGAASDAGTGSCNIVLDLRGSDRGATCGSTCSGGWTTCTTRDQPCTSGGTCRAVQVLLPAGETRVWLVCQP